MGDAEWAHFAPFFGPDGQLRLNDEGGANMDEEEGTGGEVMILMTLTADPASKGQGLGLLLVRRLVDTFAPTGLALLRAGPATDIDVGVQETMGTLGHFGACSTCWGLLGFRQTPSVLPKDVGYLWFQASTLNAPSLTSALAAYLAKRSAWHASTITEPWEAAVSTKGHCSNPGCSGMGLKKCTRCKQVSYCGQPCQLAHWSVHKGRCGNANKEL
jgi:hypothetical protein